MLWIDREDFHILFITTKISDDVFSTNRLFIILYNMSYINLIFLYVMWNSIHSSYYWLKYSSIIVTRQISSKLLFTKTDFELKLHIYFIGVMVTSLCVIKLKSIDIVRYMKTEVSIHIMLCATMLYTNKSESIPCDKLK